MNYIILKRKYFANFSNMILWKGRMQNGEFMILKRWNKDPSFLFTLEKLYWKVVQRTRKVAKKELQKFASFECALMFWHDSIESISQSIHQDAHFIHLLEWLLNKTNMKRVAWKGWRRPFAGKGRLIAMALDLNRLTDLLLNSEWANKRVADNWTE